MAEAEDLSLVKESLARLRQQCNAIYYLRSELASVAKERDTLRQERDECRDRLEAQQLELTAQLTASEAKVASQSAMTSDLKEQLAEEKARHLEAEEGATSIIEELREALSRSNLRLQAAEEGRLAAEATTAEERQASQKRTDAHEMELDQLRSELARARDAGDSAEQKAQDLKNTLEAVSEKYRKSAFEKEEAKQLLMTLQEKCRGETHLRRKAERKLGLLAEAWEAERLRTCGKEHERAILLQEFQDLESQISAALDRTVSLGLPTGSLSRRLQMKAPAGQDAGGSFSPITSEANVRRGESRPGKAALALAQNLSGDDALQILENAADQCVRRLSDPTAAPGSAQTGFTDKNLQLLNANASDASSTSPDRPAIQRAGAPPSIELRNLLQSLEASERPVSARKVSKGGGSPRKKGPRGAPHAKIKKSRGLAAFRPDALQTGRSRGSTKVSAEKRRRKRNADRSATPTSKGADEEDAADRTQTAGERSDKLDTMILEWKQLAHGDALPSAEQSLSASGSPALDGSTAFPRDLDAIPFEGMSYIDQASGSRNVIDEASEVGVDGAQRDQSADLGSRADGSLSW